MSVPAGVLVHCQVATPLVTEQAQHAGVVGDGITEGVGELVGVEGFESSTLIRKHDGAGLTDRIPITGLLALRRSPAGNGQFSAGERLARPCRFRCRKVVARSVGTSAVTVVAKIVMTAPLLADETHAAQQWQHGSGVPLR
jgi:hypothetical protein